MAGPFVTGDTYYETSKTDPRYTICGYLNTDGTWSYRAWFKEKPNMQPVIVNDCPDFATPGEARTCCRNHWKGQQSVA